MTELTMSEDQLLQLAGRALAAGGMRADEAALAARVLVLAEMFGIRTHGIRRVSQYVARAKAGGIDLRANVQVSRVAPGLAKVDGNNGVGPLVAMYGLQAAKEGAKANGIGAAFVRGSNHFGPIMPYAFLAAQDGYASIIASNATKTIAPWGGKDTRVGNNPLGIGVPNPGGEPIILDMAMSVAARAKLRTLAAQGKQMPPGWAADKDGVPTTDPQEGLDGFLLPLGGHKGYGLAVMIDLFAGLLSGASFLTDIPASDKDPSAVQDLGHFFILVETQKLGSEARLQQRMREFQDIIRSTPSVDSSSPVRTPGENSMKSYVRQRSEGVTVLASDVEAMNSLA